MSRRKHPAPASDRHEAVCDSTRDCNRNPEHCQRLGLRIIKRILRRIFKMKLLEQMQQKIKMQGLSPKTFETYAQHCEDFFRFLLKRFGQWKHPKDVAITCNGGYNDYRKMDWRLAVKVLSIWVIMRGSYAAPILDRYANPHVLPSKIGVLETSLCQGF